MRNQTNAPPRTKSRVHFKMRLNVFTLIDSDDDFSACVAFFQIADRGLRLTHFVSAIDDRTNSSGLHEVAQKREVILVCLGDKGHEFLTTELREQSRGQIPCDATQRFGMHSSTSDSFQHADAIGS